MWEPTNSEKPPHENQLKHDIRKGKNIWYGILQSLIFDSKNRPCNIDFIQYASKLITKIKHVRRPSVWIMKNLNKDSIELHLLNIGK